MGDFGSVLNCMEGRAQRNAGDYFTATFGVRHIDTITAPGVVQHLAHPTERTPQILDDLRISIEKHGSTQIGVVAHADCAGNPVPDRTQRQQVVVAMSTLGSEFPEAEVVGIWLDINSIAERIRA